jgi:hypothetical protein
MMAMMEGEHNKYIHIMRIIEPPPKDIPQPIEIMQVITNPIPEKVLRIDSK